MNKLDRTLAPVIVLGEIALTVHLCAVGLAPRIDVDCKGVQTIPACGSEKDVPDAPPRGSIIVISAAASTSTLLSPIYSTFDTTTDEQRVAPTVLLDFLGRPAESRRSASPPHADLKFISEKKP
jgi:hypothetical protein